VDEILIAPERPDSPDARACLQAYIGEMNERFGFNPSQSVPMQDGDMIPPAGILLLARRGARAIGCCALKIQASGLGEVKRLWIHPEARGLGVGKRLLASVEDYARGRGLSQLRLDTHGSLTEARSLYASIGYAEVAPFNDNRYADHWYEKSLVEVG
jgi:GNAT superfamily N-acetyltransferase